MVKLNYAYVRFREDGETAIVSTDDIKGFEQSSHIEAKCYLVRWRPQTRPNNVNGSDSEMEVDSDEEEPEYYRAQILLLGETREEIEDRLKNGRRIRIPKIVESGVETENAEEESPADDGSATNPLKRKLDGVFKANKERGSNTASAKNSALASIMAEKLKKRQAVVGGAEVPRPSSAGCSSKRTCSSCKELKKEVEQLRLLNRRMQKEILEKFAGLGPLISAPTASASQAVVRHPPPPPPGPPPTRGPPPPRTPPAQAAPPPQTPPVRAPPAPRTPPVRAPPAPQTPPARAAPPPWTPPARATPPPRTPPARAAPPPWTPPARAPPAPQQTPPAQAPNVPTPPHTPQRVQAPRDYVPVDGQINLGAGILIPVFKFDSVMSQAKNSLVVKNLAVAIFGSSTLRASSVTGVVSNRFKDHAARPGLDPAKLQVLKDCFLHHLNNQPLSPEEVKKELGKVKAYIREKICDLRKYK